MKTPSQAGNLTVPCGVRPEDKKAVLWNSVPSRSRQSQARLADVVRQLDQTIIHNTFMTNSPTGRTHPSFTAWINSSNNVTQQFLSFGGRPDVVSLAGGLPATELYPVEVVKQAAVRVMERHGGAALEYGSVEGLYLLRELIAKRMSAETGGTFTADNVLLTTGAMQGLDLIGKALVDPGDLIVAQSPTYLGALDAWRPRLPAYEALDWNDMGEALEASLGRAKFVYTVPNYSNPTGVLVPQESRAELLKKVLKAGTWLVEDDPYRSLELDGPAGSSILGHYVAQHPGPYDGPVIYLGTVSKSLVPGLRVGWIIAAPHLIQVLALAKQSTDLSSSVLTQAITLELLECGFDTEHSQRAIAVYRERRDALCNEASAKLHRWFEWEVPVGGMFVWMRSINDAIDTDVLYRFAGEEKVAFVPSSVFDFTGKNRFAMRVNFTRSTPDLLIEGVARLERAVGRYLAACKPEGLCRQGSAVADA